LNSPVIKIQEKQDAYLIQSGHKTFEARSLVNCAGLHADQIARLAGLRPKLRIIPFRGEYYEFKPERSNLVNHLIYPVPDPQMPFLGVHFTRMIDGTVEAGPNAVLAWQREGYRRSDISFSDLAETLSFVGFWKLSARFWKTGIEEHRRSFSKKQFVKSLQRLMPEVLESDLVPGGSGVRAQAVDSAGRMLDDFCIQSKGRMIHVLNAPSPAATASLSIAEHIADKFEAALALHD
jgi:L-2-hydroxyglutarate oxidase